MCVCVYNVRQLFTLHIFISARDDDRVGELLVRHNFLDVSPSLSESHQIRLILLMAEAHPLSLHDATFVKVPFIMHLIHYCFIGFADCRRWISANGTFWLHNLCMTPTHDERRFAYYLSISSIIDLLTLYLIYVRIRINWQWWFGEMCLLI